MNWRIKLFWAYPLSAIFAITGRLYNWFIPRLPFHRVQCNVCRWKGFRFRTIAGASYIRFNASCPNCGSLERQRALINYMEQNKRKNDRVLDIAPVLGFRNYFTCRGCGYVSIDIDSPHAMIIMDAMNMGFADNLFDAIICSHILEHVKDDIQAIKEMYRVLRNQGTCYVMVPLNKDRQKTIEYEKPNILDPCHVRAYGMDIIERLESANFNVELINLSDGLLDEPCFLCTK